jgi:uncharacterized protein (DUF2236 family)
MNPRLPSLLLSPLARYLDTLALQLMHPHDGAPIDFAQPPGEPALIGPESLSWRIFKNPVAVFVGGVAAVILELAEPAVRTGVWEHTSFRTRPVERLQRTGLAAMITVYGPKSVAAARIAKVVQLHERIAGSTPSGESYRASDIDLLNWVQATAVFGFAEAYSRFVSPLSEAELSQIFAESEASAQLYGALGTPLSLRDWNALLESKRQRLESSPILFEFLEIMRGAPVLPRAMRPWQRLLLRAAVEITPEWVRERLGLNGRYGLSGFAATVVRGCGAMADRIVLPSSPAVRSCTRLGLPETFLYRPRDGATPARHS